MSTKYILPNCCNNNKNNCKALLNTNDRKSSLPITDKLTNVMKYFIKKYKLMTRLGK
jgi:hypothetical protein